MGMTLDAPDKSPRGGKLISLPPRPFVVGVNLKDVTAIELAGLNHEQFIGLFAVIASRSFAHDRLC